MDETANAASSLGSNRSIDVMKLTKDVIANQPSDTAIQNLVNTLASAHIDYIALSVPMDSTSDFQRYGTTPSPRTVEAFTQKFADTIHQKGLHIIWRGTFSGIEGIYNFPKLVGSSRFPTGNSGTAATDGQSTWLGKIYSYITNHPSYFANGDSWAPLPERTEGIFSDSTSFISSSGAGLQANYSSFFHDLKVLSASAFAKIGKQVTTGQSTNNYTEVMSTWLPYSIYADAGAAVVDYYGNNHSPAEIDSDIRKMSAQTGKPVFIQEWGDYWNSGLDQASRTTYLQNVYSVLQKLADDNILAGFNYWGGWENSGEGILTQTGDTFQLNYRGQLLADFFGKNGSSSITTQTDSITPTPSPVPLTLSCPAPTIGTFTGCYYSGKFENLLLSRTDTQINFDWRNGSPGANVPADNFSAIWQGDYTFNDGTYAFTATADDGVRLYVDGVAVLDKFIDQPPTTYTVNQVLSAGTHRIKMEYYEASGGAVAKLSWQQTTRSSSSATCPTAGSNTFTACYFAGRGFSNFLKASTVSSINFIWNAGSPAGVPADMFSARFSGNFSLPAGSHTFSVTADDGVRVYIDGQLVIDQWKDQPATTYSVTKNLIAGNHNITMEYYEAYGGAIARLSWN